MSKTVKLEAVPVGESFMFTGSDHTVYEHRGNGWHQVFGQSETGGPWHSDASTLVIVEEEIAHPSQQLSCFV